MNNRREWYLIVGLVTVSIMGASYYMKRTLSVESALEPLASSQRGAEAQKAAPQNPQVPVIATAAKGPVSALTPIAGTNPAGTVSPELIASLGEYAKLKQKVLLNAEAETAKSRILHDEKLIGEVASVFSSFGGEADREGLQNAAIDLLLEARAAGSDTAASVLRSVIEDARVEKNDLEISKRSELAEIKAEVMYRWSSQEPERAADIEKWIPGPVSGKVWSNVLAAQKQNQLESVAEAANTH